MDAAPRTTAMRCSRASRRSARCRRSRSRMRAASIMIEACEESGSFDLPFYIDHLGERIGKPSLVIALDSGCGNYEQLWCTTSLRGLAGGTLKVEVLTEGVHSGDAGGVVPDSFRIVRQLLSRLEDETTGKVLPCGFSRADSRSAPATGRRRRRRARRESLHQVSVDAGRAPAQHRPNGADPQSHLAARALDHRRRRLATARPARAT